MCLCATVITPKHTFQSFLELIFLLESRCIATIIDARNHLRVDNIVYIKYVLCNVQIRIFERLPISGEDVLLIGGGPSGKDIVYAIAPKARRVCFSTHRDVSNNVFPANVVVKPDVKEMKTSSVVFEDGSEDNLTTVLYCTGINRDWNTYLN